MRRRLTWLNAGRLFVATILLGGTLVLRGEEKLGESTQSALLALVAATFALSLAFAVGLLRSSRLELLAGVQLAWDVLLVSGVVYLLGGASSSFSFLYGLVILAAALSVGPRATQATAAASVVLYIGISLALFNGWIAPPPDQDELAFRVTDESLGLDLLRNVVGFVLVGLLAGSLSERLRRTGGELLKAEASAAGLSRLNDDILRSMPSGLLTTDADDRIALANHAGARMLGGAPEELVGRPWRGLLVLEDQAVDELERGEAQGVRIDGTHFPVGLSISPLRDADERVLGKLVLFQDLTELNALREKAEHAERLAALGRLAASLAHEIRNPLGSISGSVELVRDARELGEEDRRLLDLVVGEVERLNDLVSTMLEVGRPREPEPVSIDLGSIAEGILQVSGSMSGKRLRLTRPSDPVRAHVDPAQIQQVLWNLVKNGLQHSPPDAVVTLEVGWDDESRPFVSVRDQGSGISPEDLPRIFDMFFSRRKHGVGLGLALVRQIAEAHGGRVEVESKPGEGTCFRVHLPPDRPQARPGVPA